MEGVRAEAEKRGEEEEEAERPAVSEKRGEEEEEAERPAEAGMRTGIGETDPEKEGASG